MKIPNWLRRKLLRRYATLEKRREPDLTLAHHTEVYMRRWFVVPRNKVANVYYHLFFSSDDARALHDHPWWNVSIVLDGSYIEHTIAAGGVEVRKVRNEGDIVFRRARCAHRVELFTPAFTTWRAINGIPTHFPCRTLFLTGPALREWGFHCPKGWRPWKDFTSRDGNDIGPGCGE